MRIYSNAYRDDAANWLARLPDGDEPSITQMAKAYIGGTGGGALAGIAKLLVDRRFRR
jgi:hypothetical protein